jgi:hypothetical protein
MVCQTFYYSAIQSQSAINTTRESSTDSQPLSHSMSAVKPVHMKPDRFAIQTVKSETSPHEASQLVNHQARHSISQP